MPTLHFIASLAVSLFLIGLSALLAGPAFDLVSIGPRGGLQAGALPQFVVVMVVMLAVLSVVSDFRRWRASRHGGVESEEAFAPGRQVALVGGGVMMLLAAYVFAWRPLPFPLTTAVFVTLVSLVIAPRGARTRRGMFTIVLTSVLFSIGVWLVFTYLLKVPLR
ncbi:tripartite tricarboxylate transporter TctB family protein [Chelativorans sp. YIM 93263]|uniref:tripartite tricarboxylate transporter TctB family protein n=1 Tax=Chelativorans sp. YIM 93263 TaxID=2906648 RepID=UPI002378DA8C|nr:tripartite tricarboxylate transporter TctB family protein [Chelativorans sp. YIM 93263]